MSIIVDLRSCGYYRSCRYHSVESSFVVHRIYSALKGRVVTRASCGTLCYRLGLQARAPLYHLTGIHQFGSHGNERRGIHSNKLKSIFASEYHRVMETQNLFWLEEFAKCKPQIILGSKSSSRRQIMDEVFKETATYHGGNFLTYEVHTADIDEKAIRHENPEQLVLQLAHAKADAIISKLKKSNSSVSGYLITCDQVVVHEGNILEKPESIEEARKFIKGYGRSPAQTIGSVACTNLDTGKRFHAIDIATIHFEPIPEENVEQLLEEGDVMWCAGGLMVEHPLVEPHVISMEGGLDAVMGMKKTTVLELLGKAYGVERDNMDKYLA